MVAAYVSSAAQGVATATANVSVNEPAGTTGDLLIAFCWANNTTATWTAPGGWSAGDADAAAGAAIFYSTAPDAGGSSRTFTRSNTTAAAGVVMVRVSGWNSVDASDIVNGGASSSTILPSIAAAVANTLLLQIPTKATTTAGTWTAPGSATTRVATTAVTGGASALPYCIGDEVVGSGAAGTRTWTNTNAQQTRGAIIAISSAASSQNVSPGGIASTAALGSPTVLPGPVTIAPGGRASTAVLGSPTVLRGAVNVQPGGRASTAALGTPTLAVGAVDVLPGGIASTAVLGSPTLAPGPVTISPSGIAPTSAVGDPDVEPGAVIIEPAGVASTADVGAPQLDVGPVTIEPPSIDPTTQFGDAVVLSGGTLVSPTGIAPTTQLGEPTITTGPVTIEPTGIAPTSEVGEPTVVPAPSEIGPQGIGSTAAMGEPTVTPGSVTVAPAGIPGGASVGEPTLLAVTTIQPAGIGPSSVVGTPTVSGPLPQIISPTGIASTATLGEPTVAEPTRPDECWPVDLSCVTWWDDLQGEPPEPVYSEAQKQRAIALGIEALRQLTGYRVGGCPTILRPCRPGCSPETWRTYPVAGGGGVGWQPVLVSGTWLNIGCGCSGSSCSCTSISEVVLPQPLGRISEVKIDGVVLASTAYRLDPGGRLVRTDGGRWPICQDIAAADTEPGTWSVTVRPGIEPDATAQFMAGVMAGEFLKACRGDSCRLPTGVTQIARLGVTLTLGTGAFPEGRTGIREVDSWLDRWNPNRLRTRATVISPDSRRPRPQGR